MADYSQLMNLEKKQKGKTSSSDEKKTPVIQSTRQSTEQSINLSPHRSIDPSMSHLSGSPSNRVMDKPRGFYITEHLNQQIDEAVRYYQEKHNLKKVDRSIVVTTLLANETNW